MASAWAVIEQERQVLLVRRSERTSRPGQWCFPGGGIRAGESPEQACVREVLEETGLTARVERKILEEDQQHYFLCSADPRPIALQPEECVDAVWVVPESLLTIGIVMEMHRVVRVLERVGFRVELPAT
jgi:8-oxo-dGTP diphosphatase